MKCISMKNLHKNVTCNTSRLLAHCKILNYQTNIYVILSSTLGLVNITAIGDTFQHHRPTHHQAVVSDHIKNQSISSFITINQHCAQQRYIPRETFFVNFFLQSIHALDVCADNVNWLCTLEIILDDVMCVK